MRTCTQRVSRAPLPMSSQLATTPPAKVESRGARRLLTRTDWVSRPLIDDCVIMADYQGNRLAKGSVTTTHDDAADPDPPSVLRPDSPDIDAARARSLVREYVAWLREPAPWIFARRWRRCSWHWRIRWRLGSPQSFQVSSSSIDNRPNWAFQSRELPNEPDGGVLMNGNRAALMAAPGGPSRSSRTPHLPSRPSFLRDGAAAPDPDRRSSERQRAVTLDHLPAIVPSACYTRATPGPMTVLDNPTRRPQQGRIPVRSWRLR